jgi:hypothetical protein
VSYATASVGKDGSTAATQVMPLADGTVTALGVVIDVTNGTAAANSVVVSPNADGTTTVLSKYSESNPDGSSISGIGVAGTTGDGGFYSVTELVTDGNVSQQSSYANDGKGDESETTVTYNADGSYTISTIQRMRTAIPPQTHKRTIKMEIHNHHQAMTEVHHQVMTEVHHQPAVADRRLRTMV